MMQKLSRWYWLLGGLAGASLFPAVWLLVGRWWLSHFSLGSPLIPLSSPNPGSITITAGSGLFGSSFTCSPSPCYSPSLYPPLFSLLVIGALLGGIGGAVRQLTPKRRARFLALGGGLGGIGGSISQVHFWQESWRGLAYPYSDPETFALGWFAVLPYITPLLFSLLLIMLGALMRSRSVPHLTHPA